ncbi:hypothetical protein ASPFODRAFT_53645 [Aspergillus luchuensis CBS 106.47]|uniref:CCHC-type domain-containing protein n=1 Tax=Aspergillus luchuensis (strain CBS 106.47) TaxID=1137211 RepID=A0A1M3T0M2_ASPLC|nr:hypothetical protein ASPFODRAFT_53645 [Aspergillus luchuensis CBS 106.47]
MLYCFSRSWINSGAVNQYKKNKKENAKRFLQEGGILDSHTAGQITQDKDAEAIERQATPSTQRRPPRCSNCNKEGHNRLRCPDRANS